MGSGLSVTLTSPINLMVLFPLNSNILKYVIERPDPIFLLLVSLSEHIAFHLAYLTAAISCSGLLGFYLTGVLHNFRQGLLFSLMIAILYGVLFIILRSEDAALLMGSILLFTALALLMMITRHIDWYGLNSEVPSEDKLPNL